MADKKFKDTLEALLKKDSRLVDENNELNLAAIRDLADKTDSKLIEFLLSNGEATKKFFLKAPAPNSSGKDVLVFKQNDFKFFLDANQIDNSYTAYENRIGLASGNRLLKDSGDVVLNFPYKDCVLEGGQTTEEGTDEYFKYNEDKEKYEVGKALRKEIFFNEALAQDEIDRLYEPKAFTNIKKYTAKGEEKVKEFARDKDGTITDNLIIKGNNLLALHCLKEEFTDKVKLIYIDPPYNTGGDKNIFSYNNTFNHSSWLTFIKNRLEIAKTFLSIDGFITIAIDHYELFYLGALADEVFGRENRIAIVTVIHNPKGRNQAKFFSENSEFMLVYANDIKQASFNQVAIDEEVLATFNLQDDYGKYRYENYVRARTVWSKEKRPKNWYPIYVSRDLKVITSDFRESYYELYPQTSQGDFAWKNIKETFDELNKENYFRAEKEGDKVVLYHKYYEQQVFKNVWTDKRYQSEFNGTNLLKKLIGENEFSYPKSLYAVVDIIKIMTKPGDRIMDFFGGSGTTAHATLELNKEDGGNRKFILIEQITEHVDICLERMQKVIKENNKSSFVYLELAKWNEGAKEKITKCKSLKELEKLLNELSEKYFLHYNVKLKEFKDKIIQEEVFKKLPLKKQQEMFCKMLDLNQLYVNASEMEDKKYGLSKEDIALTKNFYSK